MYLSLEGMLCFLWLFCPSFIHSVSTIYDHVLGVYIGFKDVCYKRIYYPVYGSLCTLHHGNMMSGCTQSAPLCATRIKEKNGIVSVCATLDTFMYMVQFVLYFFFNDTNMSMVVRKKNKDYMGEKSSAY